MPIRPDGSKFIPSKPAPRDTDQVQAKAGMNGKKVLADVKKVKPTRTA